ncbi:MAG: T9SS type A sorting domain-containing protein [Bacteroidota bacterium]
MLFTRYTTPLPFQGDFLQYTVTGIFHNDGWEVAEMRDVDLENVEAPSDDEAYSEAYDAIGWDWKEFGQGGFNIVDNLVYFLRRQSDSQTYRIRFADFDGSATGTTSFVLGDEGIVSSLNDRPAGLDAISLFPNPARDFAQLNVDLNRSYSSASLAVVNTLGQIVFQQAGLELLAGNNQLPLEVGQYPKGQYLVRLQLGDGVVTERLIIK